MVSRCDVTVLQQQRHIITGMSEAQRQYFGYSEATLTFFAADFDVFFRPVYTWRRYNRSSWNWHVSVHRARLFTGGV